MIKNKYESLKDEYGLYSRGNEAEAVYFVKNIVSDLATKDKWIHIISYERYHNYHTPAFKNVEIEQFERKIKPKYPTDADLMLRRAITWEAAHKDIAEQRFNGIQGPRFKVTGRSYNKNKPEWVYEITGVEKIERSRRRESPTFFMNMGPSYS